MENKKLYNYRKALNIPYMVQRLYKNVYLENPIEVNKIATFMITLLLLFTLFRPMMEILGLIPGLKIAGYVMIPLGVVAAYDKIEPDNLKIHQYCWDYLTFVLKFKLGRKKISQGEVFKPDSEKIRIVKRG